MAPGPGRGLGPGPDPGPAGPAPEPEALSEAWRGLARLLSTLRACCTVAGRAELGPRPRPGLSSRPGLGLGPRLGPRPDSRPGVGLGPRLGPGLGPEGRQAGTGLLACKQMWWLGMAWRGVASLQARACQVRGSGSMGHAACLFGRWRGGGGGEETPPALPGMMFTCWWWVPGVLNDLMPCLLLMSLQGAHTIRWGRIRTAWDTLGCIGTPLDALGHPGMHWDTLGCIRTPWYALGHPGMHWDTLGCIGTPWDALGPGPMAIVSRHLIWVL